MEGRAGPPARL
uniref:Uncharacterized protein n=1 Tax=Arundo donax TaxID=35708 RepID=A0A0A8YG81_ARUDO